MNFEKTHGMSDHPIYIVWSMMIQRCKHHKDYAGRGITVCERWQDPVKFIQDMLPTWRKGLTIERKDNNGHYEPDNCKWATRKEQSNNRRNNHTLTIARQTKTIKQWSEISGLPFTTIVKRIKLGWEPERLLTKTKRQLLPKHGSL